MSDVACFGEILWDFFEVRAGHFRRELGGGQANVATGLARLGVRTSIAGGVGRDRFGDALVLHLASDGIDTRGVVRLPNRTGLTFVTRDARGEPAFLNCRQGTADLAVTRAHVTHAIGEMGELGRRARWVIVSTSTLMTPVLAAATHAFLDAAAGGGAHIAVDLNVRPLLWPVPRRPKMAAVIARLARRAALVKASAADLAQLAGGGGIGWLRASAPGASWLVTRGAGDASAIGAHGEVSIPARRVRCVDATGAGDAFLAGSLAALLASRAEPGRAAWGDEGVWRAALEVGHAMGAKAVSRVGAVAGLVGLDRVRRRLA